MKTTLFHGSNVKIDNIDLSFCKKGKDFGCGFYLNPNYSQAMGMAQRTSIFMGGEPIISKFEFDSDLLYCDNINVKLFDDYSEEWAEFVAMNRKNNSPVQAHDFDIVIGPIADDNVGVQIRRFINGYISANELIKELRFKDRSIQYFFGTEKAINLLKRITDE